MCTQWIWGRLGEEWVGAEGTLGGYFEGCIFLFSGSEGAITAACFSVQSDGGARDAPHQYNIRRGHNEARLR